MEFFTSSLSYLPVALEASVSKADALADAGISKCIQPSILGIITSRIIKDILLSAKNLSIASIPSPASSTSYPAFIRKSLTSFLILLSSSTTKILSLSIPLVRPLLRVFASFVYYTGLTTTIYIVYPLYVFFVKR